MPNAWSDNRDRPHGPAAQGRESADESDAVARTAHGVGRTVGGLSVWAALHAAALSRHGGATGGDSRTRDELYAEAMKLGVKGRSSMSKAELARAVRR